MQSKWAVQTISTPLFSFKIMQVPYIEFLQLVFRSSIYALRMKQTADAYSDVRLKLQTLIFYFSGTVSPMTHAQNMTFLPLLHNPVLPSGMSST